MRVCGQFDDVFGLHNMSGKHSMPDVSKDLEKVVNELIASGVFKFEKGRFHSRFKSIRGSWISELKHKQLHEWMNKKISKLTMA